MTIDSSHVAVAHGYGGVANNHANNTSILNVLCTKIVTLVVALSENYAI